MPAPSSLKLEPLTVDDLPALTDLWFAAFSDPELRRVFPNTPAVRQWLTDANYRDFTQKPFQKYVKVIDTESNDHHGRPRIAAYAKWDTSMPEDRGDRYPPWHEEMPKTLCDKFFQKEEENRKRVMGDKKHFYLDTVATHPDYQRRGAGSMLVKWGCELADVEGVAAYVDASKDGAPLYAKFGFVDFSNLGDEIASMART
ncbi:acetyltransferase [Penicillium argentinense]|uniref:Acetyltransferase n=1 Tax=Penicillium argentinense TaxID=1131581 RepID=A0A9W9FF72_9EURO|nr:acetyltransferase [Penicillium argentinense]KAJ5098965.1 acetyltransferase [Penicillium argentinense]